MSHTETINQKQLEFGESHIKSKRNVFHSIDSGSDTDSVIDSPLANSSICALCNVSKHHLGQGELNRYAPSAGFDPFQSTQAQQQHQKSTRRSTRSEAKAASERAIKNFKNCSKFDSHFDTLNRIGRLEIADPTTVFDPTGHVVAHHCCAAWSFGVAARTSSVRGAFGGAEEDFILIGVDKAVLTSLSRKCKYCQSYGASVKCRVDVCSSWYHYPCAVASGAFQDSDTCSILCTPEHRHEARLLSSHSGCSLCEDIGDLSDLLFCITCGYHYHARCLSENLIVTGEVRAGWQCPDCKHCQACNETTDDVHMIICEICDKGWHTYCLTPPMSEIPKEGWSCNSCRTCSECGNKANHSGQSNISDENILCMDCQRLRNKNECCICSKDTLDDRDGNILKCIECLVNVHEECELDKPSNPSRYKCPKCRIGENFEVPKNPFASKRNRKLSDNCSDNSDSIFTDEGMSDRLSEELHQSDLAEDSDDLHLNRNTPEMVASEYSSKTSKLEQKIEAMTPTSTTLTPQSEENDSVHIKSEPEIVKPPPQTVSDSNLSTNKKPPASSKKNSKASSKTSSKISRKGSKINSKGANSKKNPSKRKFNSDSKKTSDDQSSENSSSISAENAEMANYFKTVIYPSSDKFLAQSDICAACGSIGNKESKEAQMIFCMKCAQAYHYYCSGLKSVNKIPVNGWICIHCNDCEMCGKSTVNQDKDVVTCYDCNKRVHITCANLPKTYRKGAIWKCQKCKICDSCGTKSNPNSPEWKNNLKNCSICWSRQFCITCDRHFKEDELILKCSSCMRWQHASHESIYEEAEMISVIQQNYQCSGCRPSNKFYRPKLKEIDTNETIIENNSAEAIDFGKTQEKDGVVFTENGFTVFNRELLRIIGTKKKIREDSKKRLDFLEGSSISNPQFPASPMHPSQTNDVDRPDNDNEENKSKSISDKNDKRTRKACRPGIGGFIQRSRNRCVRLNDKDNEKKIKRKKTKISDTYPQYIQEAFFGMLGVTEAEVESQSSGLSIKAEPPDSVDSFFAAEFIEPIKQERMDDNMKKPSVLSESEAEGLDLDEYLEERYCIVELEDDLPECPNSSDEFGEVPDDIFGDLMDGSGGDLGFGLDGDNEMDDIMDGIFDELNSDEEDEKKPEEKPDMNIKQERKPMTPKTPQTVFKAPPSDGINRNSAQSRPVFTTATNMPGQIIYNSVNGGPPQPMGAQQIGSQLISQSGSPHVSPQLLRPVVGSMVTSSDGSTHQIAHNSPFPANFVQMPRNPIRLGPPGGPNMRVNACYGTSGQIQTMHQWNDSRKNEGKAPENSLGPVTGPTVTSSAAKNMDKWRNDETLGDKATISPVLYANIKHPNLKNEHPEWSQRQKQIQRLWRRISQEDRAPFLTQARENRHKQKALNAKNQTRQRVSSSSSIDTKIKKETVSSGQTVQQIVHTHGGQIVNPSGQIIPGTTQIVQSPVISGQQILAQVTQSQIIQSSQSQPIVSNVTQIQQKVTPSAQSESPKSNSDHWKQFVVASPDQSGPVPSPKPPQSPIAPPSPGPVCFPQSPANLLNGSSGGASMQSPSHPPSPLSAPSTPQQTPLLSQDPFINQNNGNENGPSRPGSRNRHASHDYSHQMSPMNMMSPHSPMPPPMSPNLVNSSDHFSSPPPPSPHAGQRGSGHCSNPNQVIIPSQSRFNPSGQLQVHIQGQQQIQPQPFDNRILDHNLQSANQRSPRHPMPGHVTPTPPQVQVMSDQMIKNMERKERMRQIEQQRGTQPWGATGQILMSHPGQFGPQGGAPQNGTPRFINNQNFFNPNGIRFIPQGQPVHPQQGHPPGAPMSRPQMRANQMAQFSPNSAATPSGIAQFQQQQHHMQQQIHHQMQHQIQQQQQASNNPVMSDLNQNQATDCDKSRDQKQSQSANIEQYLVAQDPKQAADVSGGAREQSPTATSGEMTINAKIQIESVTAAHHNGINIGINSGGGTALNSNFSNNGNDSDGDTQLDASGKKSNESEEETTTQSSADQSTGAAVRTKAVAVQPPVQSPSSVQPVISPAKVQMIPQLDGYDGDSESDSDYCYPISIPQYDGNDSDGSSSGPTLPSHGTHGIVLAVSGAGKKGIKTQQSPQKTPQLVLKIDDKKKDSKGDTRTIPRNISPKPKDNSPKQTIVATAKVTKPNSPSHGSPTSRPVRIMSPGQMRSIQGSPNRSHSPSPNTVGRPISSGNTSNSSNRTNNTVPIRLVTGSRVNQPVKLHMVMASKDSKSKAKPVLIREQPLLLEEMVNEERERMAARERTSTTSGENDDPPKVNLPPPPVDPDQFKPDQISSLDPIDRAKMILYKKAQKKALEEKERKQKKGSKNTQSGSAIPGANQSRAGVSPVTPGSVRINKRGADIINCQSQPNIITLTGNQTRQIKAGNQIIKVGADLKNSKISSSGPNSASGGNPQNKFEILRQIQSESPKNQDNQTISFGGKTVKVSQIFAQNRSQSNDQATIPLSIVPTSSTGPIYKKSDDNNLSGHKAISIALSKSSDSIQSGGDVQQTKTNLSRSQNRSNNTKTQIKGSVNKNQKKNQNRVERINPDQVNSTGSILEVKTNSKNGSKTTCLKRIFTGQQNHGQVYFAQQGQSQIQRQRSGGIESGSNGARSDSEHENEAQNALIKQLLTAEKVQLTGKKQEITGLSHQNGGSVQQVSIEQLKTLGIRVQTDSERHINSPNSIKSEGSSKGSSTPTTPNQLTGVPNMNEVSVKTEPGLSEADKNNPFVQHLKEAEKSKNVAIDIKQEFKTEPGVKLNQGPGVHVATKTDPKPNRKRKQSADTKDRVKKRKVKNEDGSILQPLSLAEAPIRLNIDALTPLGGGTVARLGKDWDGLGKRYWDEEWNYGGWLQDAVHFYNAFKDFDKFKFMKKEASVPKVVDFRKDYKSLKNCFEIVVTEDENENSSDEEDFNSEEDKIESMFDNEDNLLPPPSAVDFPVAPSSPETKDSDLMFQFLEQTTNESLYRANSPEIEIPETCGSGKDPVTVTLTFRCGSDQNIEQALKAISNIIGDQIVDYTMVPDGRKKERDSSKEEKRETQISFCKKCSQPIFGNPIRTTKLEEFEYCTMSCLKIDTAVREDMSKNALKLGNSAMLEKKAKVSFRRKLFKICISDLMEKEIINDSKSKPALKPILSSFGVSRASQRKKQEEKLKMKKPENNGFWNYWSTNFGSLKSLVSNKDNPNRILPSETIISEVIDTRKCLFCKVIGENNEAGRLLFYETQTWIHVNCVIWNSMVQELKTGGLLNVKNLISKSMVTKCMFCNESGASINCTKSRCDSSFHFLCGRKANVTFHDNKSVFCQNHSVKLVPLASIVNNRKLFIQTDEISQLTNAFNLRHLGEKLCFRFGNISLASVGEIIPEIMLQIEQFRLPIGFQFTKRLWSHHDFKRRIDYSMKIEWSNNEYYYSIQSTGGLELRKNNVGEDLDSAFSSINKSRSNKNLYLISIDQDVIFGFKVPQLKKLLSSLPWMEYIEPNGVNSSIRSMFAGPVRKFTVEYSPKRFCGDNTPSSDQKLAQFVSLSADNVILKKKEERASIGLFAQKSFEADQFITEYNGEIKSIPKHYHTDPSKICIGDDLYIDGTLCVCSCRYINHNSNNPNCTFEKIIIPHDKLPRIVLRSIRSVETGDELTINFSESLNVR